MKITVETNDFCPDDCPHWVHREQKRMTADYKFLIEYTCEHKDLCKYVYELNKGDNFTKKV